MGAVGGALAAVPGITYDWGRERHGRGGQFTGGSPREGSCRAVPRLLLAICGIAGHALVSPDFFVRSSGCIAVICRISLDNVVANRDRKCLIPLEIRVGKAMTVPDMRNQSV